MYHSCIVPGCPENGRHALTVRLRRPDTSAVWAPTTGAYLCDKHGTEGVELAIVVTPTKTRTVVTNTWGTSPDGSEEGVPTSKVTPLTGGPSRV